MNDRPQVTHASSLEQELLWSVLDQDSVPDLLAKIGDNWHATPPTVWAALVQQAALGRLRAYRGKGPFIAVDLAQLSPQDAAHDYEVFVEPTDQTRSRLNEISEATLASSV